MRGLQRLFATTASLSPWRAVIIDSIDDLERNAANALLKNLEEPPPHSLFLLVSHAPERLLPTIRSRCRLLRLAPLDDDAMTSALRAALPDADDEEIEDLAAVGEGSPGRAIAWRGLDIAALDRAMARARPRGRSRPTPGARALAQSLAAQIGPAALRGLPRPGALASSPPRPRSGAAPALAEALALWERAQGLASQRPRASRSSRRASCSSSPACSRHWRSAREPAGLSAATR